MPPNIDFESISLKSLDDYLDTLHSLNEKVLQLSVDKYRSELEELVQAFSFAIEAFKSFLIDNSPRENDQHPFDSIIARFVESLKILNDSLFLTITGRYPLSRILERIAIESTVKGLFYYGVSINNLSEWGHGNKYGFEKAMQIIFQTKELHQGASPLQLEDYATEALDRSSSYLGLMLMLEQLHQWGIILRDFDDFQDFHTPFEGMYRNLSGFVHASLHSTYTYQEIVVAESHIRVLWGAQFSEENLKNEIQEAIGCIDFLLSLVLSSLPSRFLTRRGEEHLLHTRQKFCSYRIYWHCPILWFRKWS